LVEQRTERDGAEADAGLKQKRAPAQDLREFSGDVHRRYPFVIVSSRFNKVVATAYQAANSAAVTPAGIGKLPTSVWTVCGLAWPASRWRSSSFRSTCISASRGARLRQRRNA